MEVSRVGTKAEFKLQAHTRDDRIVEVCKSTDARVLTDLMEDQHIKHVDAGGKYFRKLEVVLVVGSIEYDEEGRTL